MTSSSPAPTSLTRLDILAEHLEQGARAFTAWRNAFDSHALTLERLSRRFERTWLAHLDGLVLASDEGATVVLTPALLEACDATSSSPTLAALALLGRGQRETVRTALWADSPATCDAAIAALTIAPPAGFGEWVQAQLATSLADAYRRPLLSIAASRGLALENVIRSLQSDDAREARDAAIAARYAPEARHRPALEALYTHALAPVRDAALVTGLVYGSPAAYATCVAQAARVDVVEPQSMLIVALLGAETERRVLFEHLARDSHRNAAICALGASGDMGAVDALVPFLASAIGVTARLASEAIGKITGIDTTQDQYLGSPPEGADEADEGVLTDAQARDLPVPSATAIASAWRARRPTNLHQRSIGGLPWTFESALDALERNPLRQRHAIALELELRTNGQATVPTRAITGLQRQRIHEARAFLAPRAGFATP